MKFIGYYLYNLKNDEFNPALRARNLYEKFQLSNEATPPEKETSTN